MNKESGKTHLSIRRLKIWICLMILGSASMKLHSAESYQAEWCLTRDLVAKITLENGVLNWRLSNEGRQTIDVDAALLEEAQLLEKAVEVQFAKEGGSGNDYDAYRPAGNGKPGMGSRFFLGKKKALAAGESIQVQLKLMEALEKIDNQDLRNVLRGVKNYRVKLLISRSLLVGGQEGFIEFFTPWEKHR